jgi:hypothetical protein
MVKPNCIRDKRNAVGSIRVILSAHTFDLIPHARWNEASAANQTAAMPKSNCELPEANAFCGFACQQRAA